MRRPCEFAEHLRPHDRVVTPVLLYISRHVDGGVDDELWYQEQLGFLLDRMLRSHRATLATVLALPSARSATRREIYRRIGLATDFIHANYRRKLTIAMLAAAGHCGGRAGGRQHKCATVVTFPLYLRIRRNSVPRRSPGRMNRH